MKRNIILTPIGGAYPGHKPTLKITGDEWVLVTRAAQRFGVLSHLDESSFDAAATRDIVDTLGRALKYEGARRPAPAKKKAPVQAGGPELDYHDYLAPLPRPPAVQVAELTPDERDAVEKLCAWLNREAKKGFMTTRTHCW